MDIMTSADGGDMDQGESKNKVVTTESNASAIKEEKRGSLMSKRKSKKNLNERSQNDFLFVVGAGLCLAFSAGYTNGAALSGYIHSITSTGNNIEVTQSVAGVTGIL
jgi:hypothetical protein